MQNNALNIHRYFKIVTYIYST